MTMRVDETGHEGPAGSINDLEGLPPGYPARFGTSAYRSDAVILDQDVSCRNRWGAATVDYIRTLDQQPTCRQ
jgi:hypothetical protein